MTAGCHKNLGPSTPTEKPNNNRTAALHAGAGEIQLTGSTAPTARRSHPRSSSRSNASSRLARHPASNAASGSIRLLESNATSALSCARVSLHRSHSTKWRFISATSDGSSSPAVNRVHRSSNPLHVPSGIFSRCSCCIPSVLTYRTFVETAGLISCHLSWHATFALRETTNSSLFLRKFPTSRRWLAISIPDSASSRKPFARVGRAGPTPSQCALPIPVPTNASRDSLPASTPADGQRNLASRLPLLPAPALDPRGGWSGGANDPAPRSSLCGIARYKSCTRTGSGASSGKPAENFPGRCPAHLRDDAPDSALDAAPRGQSALPIPRTPDGLPPVLSGRAPAPPQASPPLL